MEALLFGNSKIRTEVMLLGLLLTVGGQVCTYSSDAAHSLLIQCPRQVLRTVAMWQCGEHFSHVIMDEKTETHKLVTSGVYR